MTKSTQHVIVGTQAHNVIQAVKEVEKALRGFDDQYRGADHRAIRHPRRG